VQALQRTLQTIAVQLKELSSTAKLLIGSLMIILVMALFLVSLYAGQQSMAPLGLGINISADARTRAISFLESRNIPYREQGSDVLVPAEQKFTVLAQLTENHLIAADQINFDKLMQDDSPFRTQAQNRQRYLVAKMNMLANMISQMSGIERATVVIDQPEGPAGLGKSHVPPSASVTVLVAAATELAQPQVDAIAQLVAGSHAGLKRQNVAIIDARTGRAMQARTDEMLSSAKYMEIKLEAERHVKATLESALDYIPGVRIAVNAQVDATEVTERVSTFDEPKIGVTGEESSTITSTNAPASAEPAVRSNTGANIVASGRSTSQMSNERSETSSIPFVGKRDSQIRDAKGYPLQINATVGVPKSYFIRICQEGKGDDAPPPDQATIDSIVQTETEKIQKYITPLIDTQAIEGAIAGTVAVSMIPDFGALALHPPSAPAQQSNFGDGIVSNGLVKSISLGGLALLSLAMMFLMVRKAGVREELPTASELVGIPPALAAAESDLVGEADEASPALEGLELNDDAIRRQQMLEQITDTIANSPEEAAGLLRRWIKSEA
jgi:flagellar biosynthesis/type III secretory pathway M-ring protein FliF/YscJ